MDSHKHATLALTGRAHFVDSEQHAGVDGSRGSFLRLLQKQGETEHAVSAFPPTMVAAL